MRIAVIIGSTRPGRIGEGVAKWVMESAKKRGDAEFELLDIRDYNLPLLDEPLPTGMGQYAHEHTKTWAKKIAEYDGYIFVTPEYNHAPPASLKNALDFVGPEWANKAAAIVSYGSIGGVRAAEQLRQIFGQLQLADIRENVMLSLFTDFENMSKFVPDPRHIPELEALFTQLLLWAKALKAVR